MNRHREFNAPWPAVLAEMQDFVELARLSAGGDYRQLRVAVRLDARLPGQALASAPALAFKQWLQALPRCQPPPQGFFARHDRPVHRIDIDIEN